jgi:hypothetical protein
MKHCILRQSKPGYNPGTTTYGFGRLIGPFEYVEWHPSDPSPLPAWKAYQWAECLGGSAKGIEVVELS